MLAELLLSAWARTFALVGLVTKSKKHSRDLKWDIPTSSVGIIPPSGIDASKMADYLNRLPHSIL